MSTPSKVQLAVLKRLAAGETIVFGTFGRAYLSSEGKQFRDALGDRTVRVLQREGWVEPGGGDGRYHPPVQITDAGRTALAAATATKMEGSE